MRRRCVVVMVFVPGAMMQASAGSPSQKTHEFATAPIATVGAEWRRLRPIKGHFGGGTWDPALDGWQGAKHQALQRLAQHLLAERALSAQVTQLLGPPDTRWRPGQPQHSAVLARLYADAAQKAHAARFSDLWLYHWRGTHDQLVLVLGQEGPVAVQDTGWLHDLE